MKKIRRYTIIGILLNFIFLVRVGDNFIPSGVGICIMIGLIANYFDKKLDILFGLKEEEKKNYL